MKQLIACCALVLTVLFGWSDAQAGTALELSSGGCSGDPDVVNRGDADGNGNGMVDAADYSLWLDHSGLASGSNGTILVPEPTSLTVVCTVILFVCARRRTPI